MDPQPLRVVIAEDSVLLREGLARLISDSGGTVVAAVGDGPALVAAVLEHRPDVSVVDVRMPPTQRDEGLRAAIEARSLVPGSPILVLSQYVERHYATLLLADRAGGVGYLLKDRIADVRDFMDALRRVARGGTALDPEVVAQLMVTRQADDRLKVLTPREREVLGAMAEGRTNAGIAELLTITEGATESQPASRRVGGGASPIRSHAFHRPNMARWESLVLRSRAAVAPSLVVPVVYSIVNGLTSRLVRRPGLTLSRLGRHGRVGIRTIVRRPRPRRAQVFHRAASPRRR